MGRGYSLYFLVRGRAVLDGFDGERRGLIYMLVRGKSVGGF